MKLRVPLALRAVARTRTSRAPQCVASASSETTTIAAPGTRIERRFADSIARMEIPLSVRTGPYAADATKAFCDALTEKAEPLYTEAAAAASACRKAASDAKLGTGWWDAAYAAEPAAP